MTNIYTYSTIGNFSTSALAETVALLAKRISASTVKFNADGTASTTLTINGQKLIVKFSHSFDTVDGFDADFTLIQFHTGSGTLTLDITLDPMSLRELKQSSTVLKAMELLFLEEDYIVGDKGDDVIYADEGDDEVYGYRGNDFLDGGSGSDALWGDSGNDTLVGGMDADRLYGGKGKDRLDGGSGADELYGDSGNDVLKGGSGNDWMNGGSGRDTLEGGKGADSLYGGSGADTFLFRSISDSTTKEYGRDMILDFAEGDRINLRAIDANTKLDGNQAFKFIGDEGFHKKAGELRYKQYENTYIYGDIDGDGKDDFAIGFSGLLDFSKADFIL